MQGDYFRCTRLKCFANYKGYCTLLTKRCKGECKFYKTLENLQKEELKIYGEIIHHKVQMKYIKGAE